MKIAVPSTEPTLEGYVANKIGTASYLQIIETSDMSFEAIDSPSQSSGSGAGVRALSLVTGVVLLLGLHGKCPDRKSGQQLCHR